MHTPNASHSAPRALRFLILAGATALAALTACGAPPTTVIKVRVPIDTVLQGDVTTITVRAQQCSNGGTCDATVESEVSVATLLRRGEVPVVALAPRNANNLGDYVRIEVTGLGVVPPPRNRGIARYVSGRTVVTEIGLYSTGCLTPAGEPLCPDGQTCTVGSTPCVPTPLWDDRTDASLLDASSSGNEVGPEASGPDAGMDASASEVGPDAGMDAMVSMPDAMPDVAVPDVVTPPPDVRPALAPTCTNTCSVDSQCFQNIGGMPECCLPSDTGCGMCPAGRQCKPVVTSFAPMQTAMMCCSAPGGTMIPTTCDGVTCQDMRECQLNEVGSSGPPVECCARAPLLTACPGDPMGSCGRDQPRGRCVVRRGLVYCCDGVMPAP